MPFRLPEINCGHPGLLFNGWLENIESGTGLGASIIFRCREGMKLEGNTSSVCQIDGRWRYPLPQCLGESHPFRTPRLLSFLKHITIFTTVNKYKYNNSFSIFTYTLLLLLVYLLQGLNIL